MTICARSRRVNDGLSCLRERHDQNKTNNTLAFFREWHGRYHLDNFLLSLPGNASGFPAAITETSKEHRGRSSTSSPQQPPVVAFCTLKRERVLALLTIVMVVSSRPVAEDH